ncbi:MAG: DUF4293 domain-containing protein [Bacteroidales bacterium]|nr:DUF4293 domain-containing protein [Bacteroidales bacterium]
MWQRIQTLYMLVALILIAVAACFAKEIPYIVLLVLGGLCNLLPVFMFRHRMLQLRLVIFGAVVLLGLQVWMAVDYFTAEETVQFNYSMVVPVIAAILDFLAVRGIMSDELLVRSAGRLRASRKKK